jgi:hypothetical protein
MTIDYSNPMPENLDEETRRRHQMEKATPAAPEGHDEEADRIRRLKGGGGFGGEV